MTHIGQAIEHLPVTVRVDSVHLDGYLSLPTAATGAVIFAHGSGSSRHSPRNRYVADVLNEAALGTLLIDLLTADEQDAVIDLIAYEPTCGDLIAGTGGLRKVRVGRGSSGKRGGARVIYYFYNADFPLVLMALYAKNEKADLTARDKKALATDLKEITASWRRK